MSPRREPPYREPPRRQPARREPPRREPPRRPVRRRKTLRLGSMDGRVRIGLAAVCVLLIVIGARMVQLQGLDHRDYAGAAAEQRVDTVTLHAMRGQILDRNGTALAYTSNAQDITVDPSQVKPAQRDRYARTLAPMLGTTEAKIAAVLAGGGRYGVLATALSPAKAQRVSDLELRGIYTQATTQRQYPGGTTAANLLGTVHADGSGAAGIEARLNRVLAGKDGRQTYSVDNVGNVNPSTRAITSLPRDGSTVKLTIDQNLQFTAQQLLDDDVRKSGARGATMAVLDAKTGQVMALASNGTFDASDPDTIRNDVPMNPPVMSAFEPGSVQKAVTFAAALQERTITTRSTVSVPYSVRMGGVKVSDAWVHPTERFTATGVLAESSNVGTLKIAQKLGPEKWLRYVQRFGIGQKTGIELPGESGGHLPPFKTWSDSTFANLPFGQGLSMTVLQMASIYQAIANNGVRVAPRIISSVTGPDGAERMSKQPKGIRAITPQTSRTLRTMLESVTLPGGTGEKAAIPGYRIAGKTGTAQQPDPNNGGKYSDSVYWDTFAGMVPADAPQFVVAIMVDNPGRGLEGGDVAAPLFRHVASYELQRGQVPPTGSRSKHVPLQVCGGKNPAYLPRNVC